MPADVYEAAEALVDARGRRCAACDPDTALVVHSIDPPCEETAWRVLRQLVAMNRAIPGESEDGAMFRITSNLFNDVARTVEAAAPPHAQPYRVARFADLDLAAKRRCGTGIQGVVRSYGQLAQHVARNHP